MGAVVVQVASGGHQLSLGNRALFVRGTAGPNGQLHAQLGERRVTATVVSVSGVMVTHPGRARCTPLASPVPSRTR
mgnify:CR=1 FL=1